TGIQKEYYTGIMDDSNLVNKLKKADVKFEQKIPDTTSAVALQIIFTFLPIAFFVGMIVWMTKKMAKGGGVMGVGKSNAKMYVEKETGVTFKNVAGQDEAKESLQEVVDFLHNPSKYTNVGAKLPKGALLVGPPGTGKTLLAKAVAGEAKVPFFSLSGSAFVEMYVGVGASRVRDLFKQAQQMAPCIIFIDEIDAIGKSRDSQFGGNDEREQTLNQLLAEMDGFESNKGLVLLAATNRPEILDPALLRPGRFDRRIIVEKPDLKGRVDVLKVHSKDVKMDETVDLEAIALATSGAVGSDLANMINEAAINAVKHGRQAVSQSDLFEAVEVVLVGKEKKDRIMSQEERKIVSYHEVGHALISALQKDSEPVQKITIVPRTMGALGYVMHTPEEEKFLNTKSELEAMLVGFLGGRAAEEIVFNTVTTGASNDIERATEIARSMVTQYGMSEKFGLVGLESVQNKYLDGRPVKNCGDKTASEIDHEVMRMLKEAYEKAKEMLSGHKETLDKIAEFLIEKETITGKEFMDIYYEVEGIDPEKAKENKEDRIALLDPETTKKDTNEKETKDSNDNTDSTMEELD
ncbi:MAG TPA: ATP-dependent zinc metalloprotease FtsH, partial [Candidatus Dorea intestinavium]|nr:ATP-dependent zinc metalloprotease FtsH [Candidatus Dorea intestinavium]